MSRLEVLEEKVDNGFLHKILDSFTIYADRLGEICVKLDEMDIKISKIEAKICKQNINVNKKKKD